ncbi:MULTISPECIES: hypothetical protein [Hansschlegelia]|uniref:Cobalt transporter n=1 Tax=Hansschlegelia zhihuaiae TaxID=405005 RepID=A0A4Q0MDJ6_9HYPH|nr:hypothetical protein [Hansschlegelia zhihuaiae]RXF71471.1 hypothetical protein EK403_15490 [Hansschlegelia zhihuaiae]
MTIKRLLDRTLRIATVLAIALAVLSAPTGHSASHDPLALAAAEAERHAALAAEIAEHGHAHEEGDADEQSPGHTHGHDSADHLHDKAGAPPSFLAQALPATRSVTLSAVAQTGGDSLTSGLKRPPRPSFAA